MMFITFAVDCPSMEVIGAKEQIAMILEEKFRNIRVVSVEEKPGPRIEQTQFSDFGRVSGSRW